MTEPLRDPQVEHFIVEQIDSVPHLEALLLIWNSRPKIWSVNEIARSLYVGHDTAAKILNGLVQRNLIAAVRDSEDSYQYSPASAETDELLKAVDLTYRREVVRISSMIHSKASAGVRDFARAFRFTKDKE
jgi:predicted transcriptional regulator